MIINQGPPDTIEQDRADLIAQGWYHANEIRSEVVARDENTFKPIDSRLIVSRQGISSAYCNIPLKIMAKAARGDGVKLKISAELEDRADKILGAAPELKQLEDTINTYMARHPTTSSPEHWIGDTAELNDATLKQIRHQHFHFSASKMSLGYSPRFERDAAGKRRRKRYYYDA